MTAEAGLLGLRAFIDGIPALVWTARSDWFPRSSSTSDFPITAVVLRTKFAGDGNRRFTPATWKSSKNGAKASRSRESQSRQSRLPRPTGQHKKENDNDANRNSLAQ